MIRPNRHLGLLAAAAAVVLTYSAERSLSARSNDPIAPELSGLGNLSVAVTTSVPRAQVFFNQGMKLLYAFNHQESLRAFQEAARLDPQLAMSFWGQAMALGPNLNAPMTPENGRRAFEAIRLARSKAGSASPRERGLIEALSARYAADGAGERSALDRAYAAAMGRVADRHPHDPDVQTLYADALMNTMPWDYWKTGGREPKPEAATAIATLEAIIASHPEHPGAHHYYIHAVEASDDPDRAVASADRLGGMMPSAGHMVHMPAHIYIRVGRYADAAEANVKAIAADEDYLAQCQAQGLYPITYYPHNLHFLWAAATLEGRRAAAVDAARAIAVKVPHHHAGALAWTADFPVTPLLAYARFGMWREILTEPSPPADQPYAIGVWRYARGLAYVAGDRLDRAEAELSALEEVMAQASRTPLKDSPLLKNLEIASRVAEGELRSARGEHETAVRLLEQAVAIEDAFPYNEPPVWHQPPRQVLGAILLQSGDAQRAEVVYRQDLLRFRENGWSLLGLTSALDAQGKRAEAAAVRERFQKAWKRSDITLSASRIMSPEVKHR